MRQHLIIAIGLLLAVLPLHAQYRDDQFKRDAFTQTYADSTQANVRDTSSLFSFKAFFGGLAHKQTMGAGIYGGIHFNQKFHETGEEKFRTWRDLSIAGAGLVWWASLMDGVIQYKGLRNPEPSKSTFYSVLLPGLGQIYNGEAWKIPIYWGLIGGTLHFAHENNVQYQRWRWIYNQATTDEEGVERPPQSAETAKYYRDSYRRIRDYCILGVTIAYILQIVDANVFAYMQQFEVDDNITLRVSPTLMAPAQYASAPAVGMSIGLKF